MVDVEAKLKRILEEQLGVDQEEITPDAKLVHDLGCDSLDYVEVVMAAEDEFSLEISDADAERIHTVQQLVDYVNRRLATR